MAKVASTGVDPKAVVDMLTSTLFAAPIYQNYGKQIVQGNTPFSQNAITIPRKDVDLLQQTAQQVDSPTPIAHLLSDFLSSEAAIV